MSAPQRRYVIRSQGLGLSAYLQPWREGSSSWSFLQRDAERWTKRQARLVLLLVTMQGVNKGYRIDVVRLVPRKAKP